MDERLVHWVLQRTPALIEQRIGMRLKRCLGSELTTSAGRLDLLYETEPGELLVIELETAIDSEAKLRHVTDQLTQYQALQASFPDHTVRLMVLHAEEGTPERYAQRLEQWVLANGFERRTYSLNAIEHRLGALTDHIRANSGKSLAGAVALGVSSLGWLNKLTAQFYRDRAGTPEPVPALPYQTVKNWFRSTTNFYVIKRLAEDFELIERCRERHRDLLRLTGLGEAFRDHATAPTVQAALAEHLLEHGLSTGQRRVLVRSLLSGTMTKCKANLFYFLRLIHFSGGERIPRPATRLSPEEQRFYNTVLQTSYGERTLRDLIILSFSQCAELGLVTRLPSVSDPETCPGHGNNGGSYERALLTTLGSRVLGYFELTLHLHRERFQIPLQII